MSSRQPKMPDLVPVLSRGKHRHPRKGACFMELAGFLAGERWSDHPRCTHPLLATLARSVNDLTSDERRAELSPLIPEVIGLTSDDIRVDATIALRCARTALPVASAERQGALAVSIMTAERLLAEQDGRPVEVSAESVHALDLVPLARQRAERLVNDVGVSVRGYRRHAAPATVQCAVRGVAEACTSDPERLLRAMLAGAVHDCTELIDRDTAADVDEQRWTEACDLTVR